MTKVSVIIPAYNEENYIENCLRSLEKQTFKDFEIIVVDDGSTDKTKSMLERFKEVMVLVGKHAGPGASRNIGAKKAKGEVLVFVDADMTFDKEYLENLIEPLVNDKKLIGTTHDYEVATNIDNWVSNLWGKIRVSKEEANNVKIFRAIKKEKFLELGSFDPKYGYADDQTFWHKYGIKPIVAKETTCYHRNPETLEETFKQARWIGASWKERFKIFKFPILNYFAVGGFFGSLPLLAVIKTIGTKGNNGFQNNFKFFWHKFLGYGTGVARAVFLEKNFK